MKSVDTKNEKTVLSGEFIGDVVSVAEQKTIHVLVRTRKHHPVYRKQYWQTKKYAVHDERKEAAVGDTVSFRECRPLSKTKKWRLVQIMKKATV